MTRAALVVVALAGVLAVPSVEAESRINREFEMGRGGTFALDSDVGSVRVRGGGGSKVEVEINSRAEDIERFFEVEFDLDGDRLEVDIQKKGGRIGGWFGNWNKNLSIDVRVPDGMRVEIDTAGGSIEVTDVGSAELDTSGGSITARGVTGRLVADTSGGRILAEEIDGDVEADTSGGSIEVHEVRGTVHADTSGGSITIDHADGDIEADTSGGPISIRHAGGHVRADTSGGGIDVRFAPGNERGGILGTSGGGVTVWLDPGVNLDVDASASGGSVTCDLPVTVQGKLSRTSLRGKIGQGGNRLVLRASGGRIRIESH